MDAERANRSRRRHAGAKAGESATEERRKRSESSGNSRPRVEPAADGLTPLWRPVSTRGRTADMRLSQSRAHERPRGRARERESERTREKSTRFRNARSGAGPRASRGDENARATWREAGVVAGQSYIRHFYSPITVGSRLGDDRAKKHRWNIRRSNVTSACVRHSQIAALIDDRLENSRGPR